ncbi:YwhD family protein [Oceanobacillus kimchii]|uniref:YwhD family protein n=1 Tax=Oceanobacillus kimchii TaxID=746691 RepID=UPI0021A570CC|nr:YwhD family protein [Oceanobacillus kimchii]MCT1576668.1 YwhD family protein [Oceanobacillus kimchii]MCT2134738.1 YwhD family protein [Oceanobacillus kimchii]
MSSDQSSNKKKNNFTIIKDDSTDGHGGYGAGTISLENMSSVIVDPNEDKAYVDMAAMHARSDVERRVKWINDREEVQGGKLYWIVWVTVDKNENGPYYAGVAGSEIRVNREIKRAYKSMAEHVKHMEKSLKGHIIVEHMDDHSKKLLGDFLRDYKPELWENSTEELTRQLF